MIRGIVTPRREAVIRIRISGPARSEELDAVIDSGFNDFLTLPLSLINSFALPFAAPMLATLADGSVVETTSYRATIIWDEHPREVFVIQCAGEPLVGMSMLYGYDLRVEAIDYGLVTIQKHSTTKESKP